MMNDTEKTLLILLRRSVFNKSEQIGDYGITKENVDFSEIKKEAESQTVSALALDGTVGLDVAVPEKIFDVWQGDALQIVLSNEKLLALQEEFSNLLETNCIKGAVIKGSAVSYYYNNPDSRLLGDIDYIVDEKDYEKAIEIIKQNGFLMIEHNTNECHSVFTKNNNVIELHKYVNGLPEGEDGEYIKKLFNESIATNRIDREVSGFKFKSLSIIPEALTLTVHTLSHLTKGGIGLRHLLDFAVFADKNLTIENKEKIDEEMKKVGLYKFYNTLLLTVNKYFLSDKIDFNNEGQNLEDLLFIDIMRAGNFGRKTPESYSGSSLFTKRTVVKTKNGTESKVLFFKNLIWFIYVSWPITQKHKILIPVAFFYIPLRYIVRVILGKRKLISKDYIKNTSARSKFIDDLEIYKK